VRGVIRPIGSLTRRQALAIGAVAVLGVAIALAALLGQATLTTALVGLLVGSVLATVVHVRRRLGVLDATTRRLVDEVRSLAEAQTHLTSRIEFAQRRIVGAVETERLAIADRHQESLAALDETRKRLVRSGRDQTSELEALLQLYRDFQPRAPMPLSGHWAMNATGLLQLVSLLNAKRPKVVLELGSGTSTVWIAYAIERIGGRLVSVDHDHGYAERTRWLLGTHGLAGVAEVRDAPLCTLTLDGDGYQWYDVAAIEDVADIDLLLVDGPPGAVGHDARYPALRVLERRLSPVATVVLDDADRPDEQHAIERWLEAVGGLAREQEVLRNLAVFTYSRRAAGGVGVG
jgi:predicted O-methyltransferase YrrM